MSFFMPKQSLSIPMKIIGPLAIQRQGSDIVENLYAPLATFEKPVWYAVSRGAKLSRNGYPIHTHCLSEQMTRSIVFSCERASEAIQLKNTINTNLTAIHECVSRTSRFAQLQTCEFTQLGNKLYCRLSFSTGNAAGHNMVTKAADAIGQYICTLPGNHRYLSVSGNLCTDKKVSSINPQTGRGKQMIAEIILPNEAVTQTLGCTPESLVELHINKNLNGSILAGSLHSANAHVANTLLAFYLATGQDAANIVEGSQAMVHTEMLASGELYFSVTLPSIIVGSVGQGKNQADTQKNIMQITQSPHAIPDSAVLAHVCAASVLCSEISLLAAQTKPGELVKSHMILERRTSS